MKAYFNTYTLAVKIDSNADWLMAASVFKLGHVRLTRHAKHLTHRTLTVQADDKQCLNALIAALGKENIAYLSLNI